VTIFDAGEEHDLAYIAMEFLPGEDLTPYTRAGRLLPMLEAIRIVRQIAQALDYAHQAGVVHRDIKPANVMYDRKTKTVKVTDFGIARITDASKTKTGMVLGTPSFMSPEQLAGKHIDGRSDLFSLGVMLYQMLTGYLPFVGNSMAELMFRITQQPPTDPKTYNPKIPSVLVKIMMRALEKDAAQRFQTGAKMANVLLQLEAAIEGAANAKSSQRP
jgi:serine/threonine protein kinase